MKAKIQTSNVLTKPNYKQKRMIYEYREKIKKKTEQTVKEKLDTDKWPDWWGAKGTKNRFQDAMLNLNNAPLKFLISKNNKEPKIMLLGTGQGLDIFKYKSEFAKHNIVPSFDVFSLHKELAEEVNANKLVNKDYSLGLPFEQINPKIESHSELILNTKGKYDLVMAQMSVGKYTEHLSTTLFNAALLLKKGGKAYIQIEIDPRDFKTEQSKVKLNRASKTWVIFNRLVEWINKTENKKYVFKIKTSTQANLNENDWLEITRIS